MNGFADWVYEEEILEASDAYYWSPEGKSLAFLRFDDTNVSISIIKNYNYEVSFPSASDLGQIIRYPR